MNRAADQRSAAQQSKGGLADVAAVHKVGARPVVTRGKVSIAAAVAAKCRRQRSLRSEHPTISRMAIAQTVTRSSRAPNPCTDDRMHALDGVWGR